MLHVMIVFAISSILMCKAQVDKTLIAEESGPDVVRAVIGHIYKNRIYSLATSSFFAVSPTQSRKTAQIKELIATGIMEGYSRWTR